MLYRTEILSTEIFSDNLKHYLYLFTIFSFNFLIYLLKDWVYFVNSHLLNVFRYFIHLISVLACIKFKRALLDRFNWFFFFFLLLVLNSISYMCWVCGVLHRQIAENLEQRCYKDLRNESFGSVKVILCIYRKLLSSCKEQM